MASIGSFPLSIDAKSESSVLLHTVSNRRPTFQLLPYRPRRPLGSPGNAGLSFGYSTAAGEDYASLFLSCNGLIGRCSRVLHGRRITCPKATARGFADGEDGGNDVENALQATIEKSKKVLAIQRGLLQQVLFLHFFLCVKHTCGSYLSRLRFWPCLFGS